MVLFDSSQTADLEPADGLAEALRVGVGVEAVDGRESSDVRVGAAVFGVEMGELGVGDAALRVGRLHAEIDERVEGVLLAEVLEKVLLPPALEHSVRDFDGG